MKLPMGPRAVPGMEAAKSLSLLVLCASLLVPAAARGYWIPDGAALCTAAGSQYSPVIAPDGVGGVIVAWQDYRSGNYDIYVQRLNGAGAVRWLADGVALCVATGDQFVPRIIPDGAGGAIVTWYDTRNGLVNADIYAQRVNAAGVPQWTANGVAICTVTGSQANPTLASDGAGGSIITWQDRRGTNADIYVQRVDASGVVQWTTNGVPVCVAAQDQQYPTVVPDGAGGVVIAWQDSRSGGWDIYAQRVNAAGAVQWTANGLALCTAAIEQIYPVLVTDGAGGAIVTWYDYRSGAAYDIYAQRVTAGGTVQWTIDGVALCTATGTQSLPVIVSDGLGGATVAWQDGRGGGIYRDVYAQRLSAAGIVQWTANGVPVCVATQNQQYPAIAADGAGGAIVTWQDYRGGNADIYAQRLSDAGIAQWMADGVPLCRATGDQVYPAIATDEAGHAIVAWQDYRPASDYDIYAQSVTADGDVGFLGPGISTITDVPEDEGGWVRISIDRSKLDDAEELAYPIARYDVWMRIDDPAAFAQSGEIAPAAALPPGAWELLATFAACQVDRYTFRARTRADMAGGTMPYSVYVVTAASTTPSVWYASEPDSGLSIDNLAPGMPGALAGEPALSGEGLALVWDRNAEEDLAGYRVYRGPDADFAPDASNLIASPVEPACFDDAWRESAGYHYKVTAVDVHGNESGFALLAPGGVAGGGAPKAPGASYLAQNFPNPFNPATSVTFGLSEPAHVSLRIYDAAGRLVRVLVDGERPAGGYETRWNGADTAGRPVASGIYFYRLVAGRFESTKKMILLR